jgi:hypothetical protein
MTVDKVAEYLLCHSERSLPPAEGSQDPYFRLGSHLRLTKASISEKRQLGVR